MEAILIWLEFNRAAIFLRTLDAECRQCSILEKRVFPKSIDNAGGRLERLSILRLGRLKSRFFGNRSVPQRRVRVAPDAQAIFCRRRHQPRRPPLAKIRPGNPAPAMRPGTAAVGCSGSGGLLHPVHSLPANSAAELAVAMVLPSDWTKLART